MISRVFRSLFLSTTMLLALAGIAMAEAGVTNDQQPGSVLVYNLYSSGATATESVGENTRISITNTNPAQDTAAHLFFIANGVIADAKVPLLRNQTLTFMASDFDPGFRGYIIAVAINFDTGVPIGSNFLIGSEVVKLATGHQAKLNAVAFQALFSGPITDESGVTTVDIQFDGIHYTKAPNTLSLDDIPSRADGNDTLLVINSLSGDLTTAVNPINRLFGLLYSDDTAAYSFSTLPNPTPQLLTAITDTSIRTVPRISIIITQGRSGWAKFTAGTQAGTKGIVGASLNLSLGNTETNRFAYSTGSNLHHLAYSSEPVVLTVPVVPELPIPGEEQ